MPLSRGETFMGCFEDLMQFREEVDGAEKKIGIRATSKRRSRPEETAAKGGAYSHPRPE
jgi:hypothetical protein